MTVSPETVATMFTLALVVGLVGCCLLFVAPATRHRLVAAAPKITALVAIGATLGSLYFSERAGFVPCELCWYQRIAMYPMAVIVPLAILRRDREIMNYAFVLAAIGFVISAYHISVQWSENESNFCTIDDPCSAKWVEAFGFVTIPQMAAMSFFLIIMLAVATTFDRGTHPNPSASIRVVSDADEATFNAPN